MADSMDRPQYEFTPEQNGLIGSLGGKMVFVGIVYVMFGVMYFGLAALIFLGVAADPKLKEQQSLMYAVAGIYALSGIVAAAFGWWTASAGGSFRRIVSTRGHDISRLMDGLGSLNRIYSLLRTIIVVGILVMIGLVAVAVMTAMATKTG